MSSVNSHEKRTPVEVTSAERNLGNFKRVCESMLYVLLKVVASDLGVRECVTHVRLLVLR